MRKNRVEEFEKFGEGFDSSRDDEKRLNFRIKIRDKYNYKLLTIEVRKNRVEEFEKIGNLERGGFEGFRRGMMKKHWIFVLKFVTNIIINCWQFDRGEKEPSRRIWEMEIWGGDDDSIRRGMMKKDWIFVLKFVINIIINCWQFDRGKKIESKNLKNGNLGRGWWFDS